MITHIVCLRVELLMEGSDGCRGDPAVRGNAMGRGGKGQEGGVGTGGGSKLHLSQVMDEEVEGRGQRAKAVLNVPGGGRSGEYVWRMPAGASQKWGPISFCLPLSSGQDNLVLHFLGSD